MNTKNTPNLSSYNLYNEGGKEKSNYFTRLFSFIGACFLYVSILLLFFSCSKSSNTTASHSKTEAITPDKNLLQSIKVYPNPNCDKTFEDILKVATKSGLAYADFKQTYRHTHENPSCYWTRLVFKNTDSRPHTRVLYYPKGWQYLEAFIPITDSTYQKKDLGIRNGQEVLYINIGAMDSLSLFMSYPLSTESQWPHLDVSEMSEQKYLQLRSRTSYKFLLIGILLFPLLFFFIQFLVDKNKLNFYYLLFLGGAAVNLLTIVDTIHFFGVCPKIVASMFTIKQLFVFSIFLTLFGLVKYIHSFINLTSWQPLLTRIGNLLLGLLLIIALIPFIHFPIFYDENYDYYLQYYRIGALLIVVYIVVISILAVVRKIRFSRTLLLAFTPFFFGLLWYAISFLKLKNYSSSDAESLIVMLGFIITLLLFGVILGVRNNTTKREKLELEQKTTYLKELDRVKNRFYTNITHEFRTPLTVIKGMVEQLKGSNKAKQMIQRNSDQLLNMVNQLLDLAKLETRSLSIQWTQGDIVPYLQYLTESCHSLANKKNIHLAFFSKEETLVMDFDENKIQQIVVNLLSNALKFTPQYGSVKVIADKVIENNALFLKLEVQDTGNGIPKDQLAFIFDRFYQVENTTASYQAGSGIGLALVKELIGLLEGRIEVNSQIGKGTTFQVFLPIYQNASKVASFESPNTLLPTNLMETDSTIFSAPWNNDEKPLILVIEDNTDVAEYIFTCLKNDYTLQAVRDGKTGVNTAIETVPDVILCDVMMPEMDGFEVCEQLKNDQRTSHIPIVLLTAKATQSDKIKGFTKGADAYLTKPFDKQELLIRISNLVNQSQHLRHLLTSPHTSNDSVADNENKELTFLQKTNQIIEDNFNNELFNTDYLCRKVAMSRTQLHRKIKALTAQPTASYIRSYRLKKAKQLLETTDLPIGDIALEVGYKDFSHFSRSFQKEFNIKPSETRN